MKKAADHISAFIFFAVTAVFSVCMLLFSDNSFTLSSARDISGQTEKHIKNEFPLISSWRSMYSSILSGTGQKMIGDVYISDKGLIEIVSSADDARTEAFVSKINDLASRHENTAFFTMIVPTASGIYSEKLPMVINTLDQQKFIDDVYFRLDSSVHSLDAYSPLFSSRDDYVYFRTDDHWTEYGAYMVYSRVIRKLGFTPIRLSNYDLEYAERSYYGNLYSKTYFQGVQPDLINIFRNKNGSFVTDVTSWAEGEIYTSASLYYTPALSSDEELDVFLGGSYFEKCTVSTTNTEAPKLLIIKGDYANMFVPFLTPHYSEITLIDPARLGERTIEDTVDIDSYDQVLVLYDAGQLTK